MKKVYRHVVFVQEGDSADKVLAGIADSAVKRGAYDIGVGKRTVCFSSRMSLLDDILEISREYPDTVLVCGLGESSPFDMEAWIATIQNGTVIASVDPDHKIGFITFLFGRMRRYHDLFGSDVDILLGRWANYRDGAPDMVGEALAREQERIYLESPQYYSGAELTR